MRTNIETSRTERVSTFLMGKGKDFTGGSNGFFGGRGFRSYLAGGGL